ncbi:MAG: AI-2E family transporter [Comamonadaceae bacterium]|nr:MAG: AI-2E family transporter [Comamonadaceae bacterium]
MSSTITNPPGGGLLPDASASPPAAPASPASEAAVESAKADAEAAEAAAEAAKAEATGTDREVAAAKVVAEVQASVAKEQHERERVMLHMPVDVRSASLAVLATLAAVFTLHWAAAVFIPLLVSLMLTYALSPVVERLVHWHVPRWIAAGIVLLAICGGLGGTVYAVQDNAVAMANSLPVAAQKLRLALRRKVAGPTTIESVQIAATQLEQAAEANARAAARPGVTRVLVERPPFNIRDYLWTGTVGLLTAAGQLTVVLFLTFFALGSGDTFRRKMVKITGPSLHKKKITVQVLDEITAQIQRYLLVQLFTSVLVGISTGLALWGLGLENAAVWGIVAGVLNLVPYIGSIIVMGATGLVAFLQFGTIEMAVLVAGASLVIHALVGNLLTPYLTSRTSRMNPVSVFVGVLAWGWLWGGWGLLVGIPVLMVVKAVCDRVEDLQPLGELLGD